MLGITEIRELKKELQNLQQGEFRLGYVYADDIVHLVDVFKVIDKLGGKGCDTCTYRKNHAVCKYCCYNYPDQYTKAKKKSPKNAKDCDICFGASFGDCEICDERE